LFGAPLARLGLIEPTNSSGNRLCTSGTLHCRRINEEIEAGMTSASHLDDVVEDRAAGRGDDSDTAGKGRQRAFAFCIEEAFREQARLELLEGNTQGAGAARLHSFGNQLELSARLVNGDSASYEDGKTILRAEAKKLGLTAEEDD
jgi:hypothetical protein